MIIGQQKQWQFLLNRLEKDQLSHAYLFSGPEQTGKRLLAKEFAKAVNCLAKKNGLPCGVCQNCGNIEKGNYPDFLFIKPDEGKEIPVAKIREAQNFLSYKSYYGFFKIVVIDDAHLMNIESQNCFLKTLEEPKGKTIIILVSSKPEVFLPTVRSRCQQIKFFRVKTSEIEEFLEAKNVDKNKAGIIAEISDGRPGRAINFLNDAELFKREKEELAQLVKILNSDLASKFQYVKQANVDGQSLPKILENLQKFFRNLLLQKAGIIKDLGDFFPEPGPSLNLYPVFKIKNIIKLIEEINLKASLTNINPKLALEVLLMEI